MSNKIPTIVTPEGRTEWAKFFVADYKFNEAGLYGCTLHMDNTVAQPLVKTLDEYMAKSIAAAMEETGKPKSKIKTNIPYTIDDETGDVSFKFTLKHNVNGRNGSFTQTPTVIDARKVPVTEEVPVWNGSRVKVAFQPVTYYTGLVGAGVSLRLKTVQLIEALSGDGAAAAAAMFDVEDGFEFEATAAPSTSSTEESDEEFDDIPF